MMHVAGYSNPKLCQSLWDLKIRNLSFYTVRLYKIGKKAQLLLQLLKKAARTPFYLGQ